MATETRRAASWPAPPTDRQLLGAGCSAPRRAGRRGDIARRERSLEEVLEIGALAVLHVIDMPGPRGGVLELVCQPEKSSCRIDVAGLRRHYENGIDPIHRNDAHDAAESPFGLSLQYPLELAGPLCRVAVADRKEGIGLTGQDVSVESPDETDQGLADRGVPGDDYRVGRWVGGNFPALCNIGFEHLRKILRRGIAQWHDLRAGAYRVLAGDEIAGRTRRQRDHGVDPIAFDQCRTVRVEQGFERRQQRRTLHRGAGLDRPGAMHIRVDRVVQVECGPENGAYDLPNVGVDKI